MAAAVTRGHVLLGLKVGEVERGREDEDVGHRDQPLQEGDGHVDRHPLSRLKHVQLVLKQK